MSSPRRRYQQEPVLRHLSKLYPPEGKVPDRVPTETVRQQVAAELAHYLGHRNLQSTARYTALAPDRFKGFWKD